MDALVLWKHGTKKCRLSKELLFSGKLRINTRVKMYYSNKWYCGKIIDTEFDSISEMSECSNDGPVKIKKL